MVEKSCAEQMISTLASSSAKEIERREYLYFRPEKQSIVRLDGLYPQFQKPKPSEQYFAIEGYQCSEALNSI